MLCSPRSLNWPQNAEKGSSEGSSEGPAAAAPPSARPLESMLLPFKDLYPELEQNDTSAEGLAKEQNMSRAPSSLTLHSSTTEAKNLEHECRVSSTEEAPWYYHLKEEIHMRQVRSLFSRYLASEGENPCLLLTRAHLAQELLESYDDQRDLRRQLSVTRIAQEETTQLNKQLLAEIEDWRISREQWKQERDQLLLEFKMESQAAEEDRRRLQREISRLRGEVEGSARPPPPGLREELMVLKEVAAPSLALHGGKYSDGQEASYKPRKKSPRKRKLPHKDGL